MVNQIYPPELHLNKANTSDTEASYLDLHILSKKGSAQVGVRVHPVLARNSCIKCYISLFTVIILQQFGAFKIEIQASLKKL